MGRHKLYYFEGRNTGVVARTAKEARERKKRGGNKIVAVREMTDEEREKGLRGEWIKTRRDGKQPGESRYGTGRGKGPPRGTNMAKRKVSKKKAVRKKVAAKRRVSKKTPVRRATKKTAVRRIAKKVTATRASNPRKIRAQPQLAPWGQGMKYVGFIVGQKNGKSTKFYFAGYKKGGSKPIFDSAISKALIFPTMTSAESTIAAAVRGKYDVGTIYSEPLKKK